MAETISQIFASALLLGTFALAATYVVSMIMGGRNKASQELAATLNGLLDAQGKKMVEQDEKISELTRHVATLEGRIEEISRKHSDLQEIVEKALQDYFVSHPEAVVKLTEIKEIRKNDYGN